MADQPLGVEPRYRHWMQVAAVMLSREMPGVVEYSRKIILPDGELQGTEYNPNLHPGQICCLQALDSGASWCAILKPVQDGGSLVSFIPVLRRVSQEGQIAMIAYPTREKAIDAWRNKIWPILASQGGEMPKRGTGSRGGVGSTTKLPSGGKIMLRAAGGRHESGQASDTADVLLCDELDDWEDLRRIRLIERRVSRSQAPLLIYVSTIKRDGLEGDEASRIVAEWKSGTATRLEFPCYHCQTFTTLEWEMVDVEKKVLVCPFCKNPIDESQRLAMLPRWRRKDANPHSDRFSIMWTALDSPFSISVSGRRVPVIFGLCQEFEEASISAAKKDYGYIRQFWRDRMCRPYQEPPGEGEITNTGLAIQSLRSDYEKRTVPQWVKRIVMTVDVQESRHYWLAAGYGPDDRWCDIDWGFEMLVPRDDKDPERNPTPEDRRRVNEYLEAEIAQHGWQIEGTENRMRCEHIGCDVNYATDQLVPWITGRSRWHAMRGVGRNLITNVGKMVELPVRLSSWMEIREPEGWGIKLIHVNAHNVRTEVHAALLRRGGDPASGMIPRQLKSNDFLILHLSGEVWDAKKQKWREVRTRHDLLDCQVYNLALNRLLDHEDYLQVSSSGPSPDLSNLEQFIQGNL